MRVFPEVYAEMHLIFDNNFDVNIITSEIGIQPFECKNRVDTRINQLTQKHNPGFWTIRSQVSFEHDVGIVLNNLVSIFKEKLWQIKKLCVENNGEVVFDIVPYFNPSDTPAIYFNRDFLKIVEFLEAKIQLDMYILEQ